MNNFLKKVYQLFKIEKDRPLEIFLSLTSLLNKTPKASYTSYKKCVSHFRKSIFFGMVRVT